jgi:hypothetical protein
MNKNTQRYNKFVKSEEAKGRKRRPSLFLTDMEYARVKGFIKELRDETDKAS